MRVRGLALVLVVAACSPPEQTAPPPRPPAAPTASAPVASTAPAAPATPHDDDFLYLEDITGDRSLSFARAHNAASEKGLSENPSFAPLEARLMSIYGSQDRIPSPSVQRDDTVRNFWTDKEHPRGLWRRTSLGDYKKPAPSWSTILDVDALGKSENESFVFHGTTCLPPARTRCLVRLSKGGGDAEVLREFDVTKKQFVAGGFVVPEAKSMVFWKDENTLFVATNFGDGTMTKSGYPRVVKEWKRGTPLASATTIFEADANDIEAYCERDFDHGRVTDSCVRALDFERTEMLLLRGGKRVHLEKQEDAVPSNWDDELLLQLRSDWTIGTPAATYKKGSLIAINLEAFLRGDRAFQVLFEPTANSSLGSHLGTKSHIFLTVLTDVRTQLVMLSRKPGDKSTKRWSSSPVNEPARSIYASAFDADRSDDLWLWLEDFTVPASLALFHPSTGKREVVKQNPKFFDTSKLDTAQHFATSKDGTKIPYYEVRKNDRTGAAPALISAYGGFDISLTPAYLANVGAAWLERGGVFVQANLRGGGEYGPAWHEAAMKHNRQKAYDDLAAVAEDMVRRGVTTHKTLGVIGTSNGGLLTSVMLTQRPELFGAIVSRVPLTDMRRYHKLLAGASWMSEYGDPDNAEDWAALSKFSPFQNIRRDAVYPPVFVTTSTKDDRVHPGHARKLVAKLEALGHKPLYYENIEGGHGGAADITQRAHVDAMVYTFLGSRLGL